MKVCGLTDPGEAAACAALGLWAIGLVLAAGSPRLVSVAAARAVAEAVPGGVARIGVFVGASPGEMDRAARAIGLTHLQVHDVPPAEAARVGLPVIQAVRVEGPAALARARASAADLVLLDACAPGRGGGTGTAFDWALLETEPLGRPFVLAGGLTAANVGDAVARLGPGAVDVSTGVEWAPGRKDPARVAAFLAAVRVPALAEAPR